MCDDELEERDEVDPSRTGPIVRVIVILEGKVATEVEVRAGDTAFWNVGAAMRDAARDLVERLGLADEVMAIFARHETEKEIEIVAAESVERLRAEASGGKTAQQVLEEITLNEAAMRVLDTAPLVRYSRLGGTIGQVIRAMSSSPHPRFPRLEPLIGRFRG